MSVPIGTIMAYGGVVKGNAKGGLQRQGWLVCDGEEVGRDDYPELFNVLGDAFGRGDGLKTFNLPDLRGRFLRGVDGGAGQDPDADKRTESGHGGNKGSNVGSLQEDELKSHTHKQDANFIIERKAGRYGGGVWGDRAPHTGLTGGKETRPKNIYVNWIIKAKDE